MNIKLEKENIFLCKSDCKQTRIRYR